MKPLLLFVGFLFGQFTFAQEPPGRGYQNKVYDASGSYDRTVSFAGRAKALGIVVIEDEWIRGLSLGGEVIFYDRFSIVVDIVQVRFKHEREVPINPPNSYTYNEYWQKDLRNYVAFEFRYYPSFVQFDMWKLYLNSFGKLGGRFVHTEDLYPLSEDEVVRLNSNFSEFGGSIGFKFGYDWGFDFNLGAAYRNELKNEDRHHKNAPTTYHHDIRDAQWKPNCRASFFLNF